MRTAKILALSLLVSLTVFAAEVPRPAPDFEVKTLDGSTLSLEDLRGKVVLVMFMSTDCPHCQRTTQILNPIYLQWKSRGLEIVSVAINPAAAGNLEAFARKYNVQFPLALGTRADCTRFANISVMSRFYVPYVFIVDRNGVIRKEHPGGDRKFFQDQENNFRTELDALLKESEKTS